MKHIQDFSARYVLPTIEEKTAYGFKRLDPYTKLFEEGKRYALEHSRILIHQPSSEGGGQASDVEIQAKEIARIARLQEELLARHVVKSAAEIEKDIERDKILTAAEAVEYGIIDQVLASRKAKPVK